MTDNTQRHHVRVKRIDIQMKQIYLAILTCLIGITSASASSARPNVLLILSDDHSVPHVGAYGGDNCPRLNLTPNLDALAKDGIRFDRAYTASPQCAPSRTAIFAGRSPVGLSGRRSRSDRRWYDRNGCPHASTWRLDTSRCRMGQRPVTDADHSTRYGRTHRTVERCSKLLTQGAFSSSGSQGPKQTANELRARQNGESAIVSGESDRFWPTSVSSSRAARESRETRTCNDTVKACVFHGANNRVRSSTLCELAGRAEFAKEKEYTRQDSNLQPSVPKTDALSNCATGAIALQPPDFNTGCSCFSSGFGGFTQTPGSGFGSGS